MRALHRELVPQPLAAWLLRRPGLRKAVANSSWAVALRAGQMVGALIVGVWVVRYLGAARFGELNFAIAFVSLFGALASLGLDGITVRNLVAEQERAAATLGTTLVLKLAGALGAAVLAIAVVFPVRHDPEVRLLVAIISAGSVFGALDSFDYWFQSRVDARSVAYARGAAFLVTSAAKVALVIAHAPLWQFAAVTATETAVAGLGLAIVYRRTGGRLRWLCWDRALARAMLRDSWPLIFSGIMIVVYMRIDQVMLGASAGDREVGIYSVAVRLAEVWYVIPSALVASVFPSVVQAKAVSEALFYERLQRLYDGVAILCHVIAVGVTLTGPWVIRHLYGNEYAAAGPVLIVLIWSLHFTALGVARSVFLTAVNWTRTHLFTVCGGALVNVLLNLWLIPRHGALGAAIASLVAYWAAAHGACFVYRPLFRTGRMLSRALLLPRLG